MIIDLVNGVNRHRSLDVEIGFSSETTENPYIALSDTNQKEYGTTINNIFTPIKTNKPLPSTNVADLNGSIHSLYLRTNLPVLSTFDSRTGAPTDILGKLPINTSPGGIIFVEGSNNIHKSLIQTKVISALQIRLTDDRNRPVNLNGLHFSISILLEFVSLKRNNLNNFIPYKYNNDSENSNIVQSNEKQTSKNLSRSRNGLVHSKKKPSKRHR